MNGLEPTTDVESEALKRFGWHVQVGSSATGPAGAVLEAYRAGFAAGRNPPEARVFRAGDPEPGPEVTAVLDGDEDRWTRDGAWWTLCGGLRRGWPALLEAYGPLVHVPQFDYDAALDADAARRAASESSGGAR